MPNSYLSSNTGTATNAKKFTLSMWIKRGNLCDSNSQRFYQGYKDSNNRFYVMFDNTSSNPDTLWIYAVTGGTIQVYWTSARKFRDTNSWYHFVFQADSTLGTAADRLKVYVNGVLETSFTKNNNPGSNIDWGNQLAQTNSDLTISGTESQTQHFDGYISHIAFVDGQALAPTSFGETDSTSGIWKFKSPSGITWGNNGYHLKFENSANLGLDSSGNSNNFTVNGNLKQALDTPSNVHATFNSLIKSLPTGGLSGGNNTAKTNGADSTWRSAFGNLGASSGKYYMEVKWVSGSHFVSGFASQKTLSSHDFKDLTDTYSGGQYFGIYGTALYTNGSSGGSYTAASSGDIIQLALDMDNKKIYQGINGTWNVGGNPASGNGISITGDTDEFWTFGISVYSNSGTGEYQANFGNGFFGTTAITSAGSNGNGSLFEYDVPNGYYALNTKNINTYG
jgi:hypothetical protein